MRHRHLAVEIGLLLSLYLWLVNKYFWLSGKEKKRLQAAAIVRYGKPPDHHTDLDRSAVIAWFLRHIASATGKIFLEEPRDNFWQVTVELPHRPWSRSMTRARLVYDGYTYWVSARKLRNARWKCYVFDPKKGWTRLIVRPEALSLRVVRAKTVARRASSHTKGPVARHTCAYPGIQLREKARTTAEAIARFGST